MNQHDAQQELVKQLQRAEDDPDVPKIYCNGFINVLGAGDILLLLKRAETPVAVINMSHTVAKTLMERLKQMIGDIETRTDQNVLNIENFTQKLSGQDSDA